MSLLDAAGVINGDIWCNGAFDFESPLKDLLESGDYNMEQLLAEDELLQELRGMHPQLIDFFSSEEAVSRLIQYIIIPPSAEITTEGEVAEMNEGSDQIDQSTEGKEQLADATGDSTGDSNNESKDTEISTSKKAGEWLQGDDPTEEEVDLQKPKSMQEQKDDLFIRFPYMACEVICCEIKGIIDIIVDGTVPLSPSESNGDDDGKGDLNKGLQASSRLISDEARGKPILDLLYSILYKSEIGEIDDYRAGYFEKVLSVLFRHRPKDVAKYLNEGGGKGDVALMSAMFNHLYSHSLMQIVQRLLLPQPPLPPSKSEGDEGETGEGEDLFNDTLEGADLDPLDSFRCSWSESEIALQMILDCLVGNVSDKIMTHDQDDVEERKLDLYQNASEVLITIIQNSPLTSQTMRTLTTDPNLGKLITATTCIEEGCEFSRHDSRLTCAMNVLESIILQLGGYGSVGTMMYDGEGQDMFESVLTDPTSDATKDASGDQSESLTPTSGQHQTLPSMKNCATPEILIKHLPTMLSSLSNLLIYQGAEKWVSPMQFSKVEGQKILGSSRLRIVRLLESLVLLGNRNIDSLLCDSSCLEVCLDLFWKFQWCSMLHQSVANLLVHAFEGQNSRSELQTYFIVRCNLLGRLMYSFWEKEDEGNIASIITSNAELSASIAGQKDSDSESSPFISSTVSEKDSSSTNDILPVSDDDVDAAIERQEDAMESNENIAKQDGSVGDHDDTKITSLRLGYMGHVIIICQALVHACLEENENDSPNIEDPNALCGGITDGGQQQLDTHLSGDNSRELMKQNEDLYSEDYTSADDTTQPGALILARLVKKHPLGKIWNDFVVTTLASETALQTTPLGGFQASTFGTDPLHMHRPGLEDDGAYDDDDVEAPTLPQRGGLLGDGDVIDMDDNDLEVAANMMAGLNLAQVTGGHGEDQAQSNPSQSGYIFDDPLGGERFGDFDSDDDGNSSSDEEPENTRGSGSAHEAPVMDLFAGNFDAFDETDKRDQSPEQWSDFANFDDAFAGLQAADVSIQKEEKNNFDRIFGDDKSHDILLDEADKPLSPENGEISIESPADIDGESNSD